MTESTQGTLATYQETLHDLNQRYKREWDRAERLQDELDHIKNSRSYRFARWLGRLLRFRAEAPPMAEPPAALGFNSEILGDARPAATGSVTILIPFKDRLDLLRNCVRSLRRGTYQNSEILLLDNGSICARTLRYLERGQARFRFRVLACPGPFNFARICNLGASQSNTEYLCFLNNDIEVLTPDWLECMLQIANREDVGIVGGTLLYPNRTIQHAGVFPTVTGQWTHAYRGMPDSYSGDAGELRDARSVPAVTGACLMIRRHLFSEVGGFDEAFPLTFNDIDLCLRVRKLGFMVAITPHARLWHYESLSRGYSRDFMRMDGKA